ncbi:MAG: 1,4-alpha-glucan branching protein GlgB [Flavobacteriales bacterium]|nr:1,4-alpha-glucan branching protein GlgB [Flavobacteriales bacterium]
MNPVKPHSLFSGFDIDLFRAGKHTRLYEKLGAHPMTLNGEEGTYFAVWAPSAKTVFVVGNFNHFTESHELYVRWDGSGIWEGFIPNVGHGEIYKYKIHSHYNGIVTEKADPFARYCEHPPMTASIIWDSKFDWEDSNWMQKRAEHNALDKPFSVYEIHAGSWRRNTIENRSLTYREMADELVNYVSEMEFTHVEFMPIMEYPYDPSWGYQLVGYFAPTSRFGAPEDFKYLINAFHQKGIGVILDWVPSHFPSDAHGLGNFDGTHLYEHPDIRKGYHPDWKSLIFNYERPEVRSFLMSNAIFWLDQFHADGLRVDAVASMLYLDYSRKDGEWEPNKYGGRENLAVIDFLKDLNKHIYHDFPDVQTIAEESTSFPMVSRPTSIGGLGFGMKWMMGWMHDTLEYFKKEPIYRKHHHNDISFSLTYAFTENFMLPLSHDEVVYGKHSIMGRMPGDNWQRRANLRLLYGCMFTHPGTNLLFMGAEFGQEAEWNFETSLDWHLLDNPDYKGIQSWVKSLNQLYKNRPALYELQFNASGFQWISYNDHENSILVYLRKGKNPKDDLLIVANFTPVVRDNYRFGVPVQGPWKEILCSDDTAFGGSGVMNHSEILADTEGMHQLPYSISLTLPPLAISIYALK